MSAARRRVHAVLTLRGFKGEPAQSLMSSFIRVERRACLLAISVWCGSSPPRHPATVVTATGGRCFTSDVFEGGEGELGPPEYAPEMDRWDVLASVLLSHAPCCALTSVQVHTRA